MKAMGRRDVLKGMGAAAAIAAAQGLLPGVAAGWKPSGALPRDVVWHKTPCRFCGVGCGLLVGIELGPTGASLLDRAAPFAVRALARSVVGQWLAQSHPWLSKIAGILIIVFGVHLTGLVRIPFLTYTRQFQTHRLSSGLGGALLLGMAFAFGWTPCIGPILASILTLAATQDTIWHGVELLLIYSLGLGVPFVLVAAALGPCLRWLAHYKRFVRAGEIAAGLLLITVGSLIATNRLTGLLRFIPETFFQFAK